jgi:N-methylhydantoinase B
MGIRRVYRAEADCLVRIDGSRLSSRPWGLAGGEPGASGAFEVPGGMDGFVAGAGSLSKGQIISIVTPGGGGYGRPA